MAPDALEQQRHDSLRFIFGLDAERRLRNKGERTDDRPLQELIESIGSAETPGLCVDELSFQEENFSARLPRVFAAERHDPSGLVVGQRLHQRRESEELQITGERGR